MKKFPKGFLWGAATSGHQVEGGNIWNDWHEFEEQGFVKNKEKSGLACDHYNRYREDFDLAKELNLNAQRISIEWSRIEKKKGVFDQKEIEHYKDVLKYLKQNGFTTFVTLHHFTNPTWFANEGGWANNTSVDYFVNYAKCMVEELSEWVDFWSTFNEPMTPLLSCGYLIAAWPPQRKNPIAFLRATLNTIKSHNAAYEQIKTINPKLKVGLVYNTQVTNGFLSRPINYFRNGLYLNSVKGQLDFIGLNYYFPLGKARGKGNNISDLGWEIEPSGLSDSISYLSKRYEFPIYITENGIADRSDKKREKFIVDHLSALHGTIKKGADVRGYFHWSLLDNFEWAEGFEPRFGLIEVDYKTQKRIVRPSAKAYAKITKSNAL